MCETQLNNKSTSANEKKLTIVWFLQDLRLTDNPAVIAAVANGEIVPVFIADDTTPSSFLLGGASKWWLYNSLLSLNRSLNNQLVVKAGNRLSVLQGFIVEYGATQVVWNRLYEPW